jgi:diketogulonate reductase-like aldo/keto reductase
LAPTTSPSCPSATAGTSDIASRTAFDRTLDAYRALEQLLAGGKVRAIGVSNFMPEHLDRLLGETSVVPAVNQIELHPYFQQSALQQVHAERGILTRRGRPSAGSPPTAAPRGALSTIRRCWRSRASTARRPLR